MKKVLIFSLAFVVFCSSFFNSVHQAQAVGVDTVVKLVGGKAIVRALAEKAGMALSKKQIDNVAGYIEKKTFAGDSRAIDFAKKTNDLTPSTIPTKSGFKKYVLEPLEWLSGLDLIFEAVEAFQDGYDTSTPVPLFGTCGNPEFRTSANYTIQDVAGLGDGGWYAYTDIGSTGSSYFYIFGDGHIPVKNEIIPVGVHFKVYRKLWNDQYYSLLNNLISDGQMKMTVRSDAYNIYTGSSSGCNLNVTEGDVINISNVDNRITTNFDNDTYNTNTTYNMEIDVPDVINYNDTTVWNDTDTTIINEIAPEPPKPDKDGNGVPDDDEPDSDNDGVKDDTDSTPDNPDPDDQGGLFENLIPILFLVKLLGLLGSVLAYFGRLLAFIMTIPLIPSKTIDNEAFQWFREAKILGVYIYQVVSSLAAIGLSFSVYRAVRRLF